MIHINSKHYDYVRIMLPSHAIGWHRQGISFLVY